MTTLFCRLRAALLTAIILIMENELAGLWSANRYEGTDSGPAEEHLIFKADGTGRYEVINYFPEFVELFRWHLPAPGRISLFGFKRLNADYEGGTTEEESLFQFEDTLYQVREQANPPGRIMQVLTLSLPDRDNRLYKDFVPEKYGLIRKDLNGIEEPNFTWWKNHKTN